MPLFSNFWRHNSRYEKFDYIVEKSLSNSISNKNIGLTTKFLHFFLKILFYFLIKKIQLSFNNVGTISIYDLAPTLWKRKDPTFVEILGLLAEEVVEVHFQIVFGVKLFSSQIIRHRMEEMIVSRGQV